MGLGIFGTSSENRTTATQTDVGATDQAVAANITGQGPTAFGSGAQTVARGTVAQGEARMLSGTGNVADRGMSIYGSPNAQITTSDPAVAQAAFDAYLHLQEANNTTLQDLLNAQALAQATESENLQQILSSQSDIIQAGASQSTSLVGQILSKLGELAESKQTEGESGRNQIVLWVVLGVLAVAALLVWTKRH